MLHPGHPALDKNRKLTPCHLVHFGNPTGRCPPRRHCPITTCQDDRSLLYPQGSLPCPCHLLRLALLQRRRGKESLPQRINEPDPLYC